MLVNSSYSINRNIVFNILKVSFSSVARCALSNNVKKHFSAILRHLTEIPFDLFKTSSSVSNFQGIRKRIIIAPDYSLRDEQFNPTTTIADDRDQIDNEYNELDLIGEQFEAYVRPPIEQSQWISNRKYERNEINRLGDIIDFYDHKPELAEFEKRIYKRITRQDRSVQTDAEPEKIPKINRNRNRLPAIRLPLPLAMERVEQFLVDNHWRLVDLFRTLDRNKSWNVVKQDFMRLVEQVNIHKILTNRNFSSIVE